MKILNDNLVIDSSEALSLAGRGCNADPSQIKCMYDKKGNDFRGCDTYKLFAALDEKFEAHAERSINHFKNQDYVRCPVLNKYGRPRANGIGYMLLKVLGE